MAGGRPHRAATVVLAFLGAFAAGSLSAGAGVRASEERIASYEVRIDIGTDGSLRVTEQISYDFGANSKHGIIRDIVNRQRFDADHDRLFPVRDIAVRSPRAPAQFEQTESDGKVHVKIGDPHRTVTGRQDYTVAFTVLAAATRFPDHDELYWNAIGPGWPVPIDRATVRVTGPAEIDAAACYAGPVGSRTPCASATTDGSTALYRGGPLQAGEALTVVAGLPIGSIAATPPMLAERRTAGEFLFGSRWAVAVGIAIIGLGVAAFFWRRRQAALQRAKLRTAERSSIVSEPAPPEAIPPGVAGLLVAGRPERSHVVATLVDLAGRGYLTIELADPGKWRLRALQVPDAGLRPWEHTLLSGLFEQSRDVRLTDVDGLPYLMDRAQGQMEAEAARRGWLRHGITRGGGTAGSAAWPSSSPSR